MILIDIDLFGSLLSGMDPGFRRVGGGGGRGDSSFSGQKLVTWLSRGMSQVSFLQLWCRAYLRAMEGFGFLMLKYTFSHILDTLLSF